MSENTRSVLIVGGTGGMGECFIEAFCNAGYNITFTYNTNKTEAETLEKKYACTGIQADATREEDVIRVRQFIDTKKAGALNAVVYAAGIFKDSLLENMNLEKWNQVLAVNLTGPFLYGKHMIELLRNSKNGRFVCIGSVMGESGIYGSCSYGAAKAGLIGLVKSIALENARHGVTANVVSFGYIDTGMTWAVSEKVLESAMKKIPMKRLGAARDAAQIVVDLCSPHTNYVSGQVIRCNGALYV